jgi:hypothetical protein
MASANVRISRDTGRKIRRASNDAIGRDMLRRGFRVQKAAKQRLRASPRRIDTGRLINSIFVVPVRYRGTFGSRVGTNVTYAMFVHDGTGIYGPRKRLITPTRKKFLRFRPKGSATYVYARKVRGMRPNPFLRDALPFARG